MAWLRGWDYSRDISAGEATENRRSGYGITKICKNKNKSQKPSSDSRTGEEGPGQKSQVQKSHREQRTGGLTGLPSEMSVQRGVIVGLRAGSLMAKLIDFQSYSFKGKGNSLKIWQQVGSFTE